MTTGFFVFCLCALLLVLGYKIYGKAAEYVYGLKFNMLMPCMKQPDGVDYVPMPTWRIFMIQLLNIAGLGPVFGAFAGCLFGPVALLWIVFGCILAGAVHDFLAAAASAVHGGENLPELVGRYLGRPARYVMRALCILLMLLVGVVFTTGPAGMLHALVSHVSVLGWCIIILLYYLLATVLPIDVIIGKIYPLFGVLFIFMAIGLGISVTFSTDIELLPSVDFFTNAHPQQLGIWPMIFVTIACGAISGFHATQSPMMVRCLQHARNLRPVFYGAMVVEGLVALVWCTVGLTLREMPTDYVLVANEAGKLMPQLAEAGQAGAPFWQLIMASPATAVNQACTTLLGPVGAVIAVLGVVVLPITSGDTAMRCCRLMVSDIFGLEQTSIRRRLLVALPLFALVIIIANIDFSIIWRYFGWANQALACFTLWTLAVLLRMRGRFHWIVTVPALFMTTMCTTYLLCAPDCYIGMPIQTGTIIGGVVSVVALVGLIFIRARRAAEKN